MNYTKDKLFTIPAAFTALNGCAQTIELEAAVALDTVAADESEAELLKEKVAQANLLRVLEVLRSAGAQPIITKVKDAKVTFVVEQAHVYGEAGDVQVSSKKDLAGEAKTRIEKLFTNVKTVEFDAEKGKLVSSKTDLLKKDSIIVDPAIGALV